MAGILASNFSVSNLTFADRLAPTGEAYVRYAAWLPAAKHVRVSTDQPTATPLVRMGEWWLKREDENVVGSHKFRSLSYQLATVYSTGGRAAVLSSSGNAAIAASRYAATAGVRLLLLLSPDTPPAKLAALTHSANVTVVLSSRARRLAKYAATRYKLPDLRPSVDPNAAIGLRTLGFEIYEQLPTVANIFTFVTSGASLLGIYQAFVELRKLGAIARLPRLYGVYSLGTLAGTLAGGGVDTLHAALTPALTATGGALVAVDDSAIVTTRQQFAVQGITTSAEGSASCAAATEVRPAGETVVILSGAERAPATVDTTRFHRAESFAEIDALLQA